MKTKPVRKTEADWLAHVIASGKAKSMTEYAKAENIDANQLYLWKSKLTKSGHLEKRNTDDINSSIFEKVSVTRTHQVEQCCKIALPNKIVIEIPWFNDLNRLSELVTCLGEK